MIDAIALSFRLTAREAEVLYWVVKGKTNRDIGDILGMSPRTVTKHMEHILGKLGVETRTAAAGLVLQDVAMKHPVAGIVRDEFDVTCLRDADEYPEAARKTFELSKQWFNHDFPQPAAMSRVMAWDPGFGGPHGRAMKRAMAPSR